MFALVSAMRRGIAEACLAFIDAIATGLLGAGDRLGHGAAVVAEVGK
jgi:hypothetical protein